MAEVRALTAQGKKIDAIKLYRENDRPRPQGGQGRRRVALGRLTHPIGQFLGELAGTAAGPSTYRPRVLRSLVTPLAALALAAGLAVAPAAAATAEPTRPDEPTIEDYASYDPQTTCHKEPHVGTEVLGKWLVETYGGGGGATGRGCGGGASEHKDGRAIDWTLTRTKEDRGRQDVPQGGLRDRRGGQRARPRAPDGDHVPDLERPDVLRLGPASSPSPTCRRAASRGRSAPRRCGTATTCTSRSPARVRRARPAGTTAASDLAQDRLNSPGSAVTFQPSWRPRHVDFPPPPGCGVIGRRERRAWPGAGAARRRTGSTDQATNRGDSRPIRHATRAVRGVTSSGSLAATAARTCSASTSGSSGRRTPWPFR